MHRCHLAALALAALFLATSPYAALASCKSTGGKRHFSAKASQAAFVFGQQGGNIRPFQVSVTNAGAVTATGPVAVPSGTHLSADALNGLLRLAEAEGFFSMPKSTQCAGTLPDVAARYLTITTSSGSRRISVHGGCSTAFNQLFAVLMAATGASFGH